MAKLKCVCGAILSNCLCPGDTEGYLLTDRQLSGRDEWESYEVITLGRGVWECHCCGRLGINHPAANDFTVKWYSPDDGIYGELMKHEAITEIEEDE